MQIGDFVVAGIPLMVVVFGIVEFSKALGATGKLLTILSFVFGFAMAFAYQVTASVPVTPFAWLTVVVVGLIYGVTASGVYDFLDARFPVIVAVKK